MNEKKVTLSIYEIIQLRSAIRARLREINRILRDYKELLEVDLPGVKEDKDILGPLYERLGNELDKF